MSKLVLLRHGQSEWNAKNVFTGWVDVDLSPVGETEARIAGETLKNAGLLPDAVHTSLLTRAIRTAAIALEACDCTGVPVRRSWRLNERHYGALQGLNKDEVREQYGEEQFLAWRRGYDTPPPAIEPGSEWDVSGDQRYANIDGEIPLTESLKTVVNRVVPYFESAIKSDLNQFGTVMVAAHGNSLRALIKHLEQMSDQEIVNFELATGSPRVYELDSELRVLRVDESPNPLGRDLHS